jgi:hypothetical protein
LHEYELSKKFNIQMNMSQVLRNRYQLPASGYRAKSFEGPIKGRLSDIQSLVTGNRKLIHFPSTRQQVQHSHTHRYPIFNLVKDDRLVTVCGITVQLHAPVDGSGVHDHYLFAQAVE